jgi:gliding motility-associated-like protein
MIKATVLKWKTLACLVFLLTWIDTQAQCDLSITNPPCSPGPVNLTSAAITAGTTNVGTLTYWMNPQATVPLANPTAVTNSGFYYIKNTVGSCSDIAPVAVTIGTAPKTDDSDLNVLCGFSTAGSVYFDFDDVGQTQYNYSYQINGGPIVYGSQTAPSSYAVLGLAPGDQVVFTVAFTGVCHPPMAILGYPVQQSDFPNTNTLCVGTVLPTTSPNGVTGVWNKPVVLSGTQNYTFTPPACQIGQIVSITSITPVTPTFNAIPPVCQGSPAPTLPTTSTNGITGTWSGTVNTANVGTQNFTFTPTAGQCANANGTISVTVNAGVTPTFNPIPAVCQGSPAPTLPTTSTNGITGTWSGTVNTANAGTQNFTFTPAAGQCANANGTISVTVTPTITPTFNAIAAVCQGSAAPTLPTTSTNGITGTWNPTTISTATAGPKSSTFTPTAGQCASATPVTISVNVVQNVTPTFNAIPAFCAGTTAPTLPATSIEGFTGTWAPATINNTTSGPYTFTPSATICATPTTINVTVTPAPAPVFAQFTGNQLTICSGSPVQPLPTTSSNGVTGSWNPAAISNTASASYTFTPTSGLCSSPYILTVNVTPTTTIQFAALPPSFSTCVDAAPPPLPTTSDNGITGTWTPSSIDTSTFGVKTLTFQATAGQCVTSNFYTIYVDVQSPRPTTYGPFAPFCMGGMPTAAENPGGLQLPTTVNGIVGTWSPSSTINNAVFGPQQYIFTPAANQCAESSTLNFIILEPEVPIFTQQQIAGFCAGTTPIPTLPTISDNGITGTWVPAVIDNMLTGDYTFIPDASFCATNGTMHIEVEQPTPPGFDDPIEFCADDIQPLDTTSPNGITGTWTPAVVDPSLPSQIYHFEPDAGQCATSQDVTVVVHQLTLNTVTVVTTGGFFTDSAVVTVNAMDPGNYLYQLEDGPLYSSNVFTNVPPGIYDVTVYDVNGCSPPITLVDEVVIVDYPKFFTPNGDGYNDRWNIFDLVGVGQGQAAIFIFDRHGKLIKQIAPAGLGWDGTYNGQPLPSSDYWFLVNYTELGVPKEFKAHFSLKR